MTEPGSLPRAVFLAYPTARTTSLAASRLLSFLLYLGRNGPEWLALRERSIIATRMRSLVWFKVPQEEIPTLRLRTGALGNA